MSEIMLDLNSLDVIAGIVADRYAKLLLPMSMKNPDFPINTVRDAYRDGFLEGSKLIKNQFCGIDEKNCVGLYLKDYLGMEITVNLVRRTDHKEQFWHGQATGYVVVYPQSGLGLLITSTVSLNRVVGQVIPISGGVRDWRMYGIN